MWYIWRKIRYDIRNMTSRHKKGWRNIQYDLEENPVWFGGKCSMVGRCDFVAFWVDLRLQYLIITIFMNQACVRTTEQSRTAWVEYSRLSFGEKSGMFWRKIRYDNWFGEKSGIFGEKSGIFGEKSGIDTNKSLLSSMTPDQSSAAWIALKLSLASGDWVDAVKRQNAFSVSYVADFFCNIQG